MRSDRNKKPFGEEMMGLPGIVGIEISRVRFDPPKRFYSKGRLLEHREAVQIMVKTTRPMPILDLTPVLFIGDLIVNEYEPAGKNLYRFYAYELQRLKVGAPISFGWPYARKKKIPTSFKFNFGKPPLIS
jgi:hypothetical protein